MSEDKRPPVWIGHVTLRTPVLEETERFMTRVGMRTIFRGDEVAVLELRGGTHVVLIADADAQPGKADFDLMVEDIDATYADYKTAGFELTEVHEGNIHKSFTVTEPGGHRIVINSTHVRDHSTV